MQRGYRQAGSRGVKLAQNSVRHWAWPCAILLVILPFFTIYVFHIDHEMLQLDKTAGYSRADYKDALGFLSSCSQWLVTVSISTIAASGYLFVKSRDSHPWLCGVSGTIIFCASITSIYYSIELAQCSANFLAKSFHHIEIVSSILVEQAIFALVAASCLPSLALGAKEA